VGLRRPQRFYIGSVIICSIFLPKKRSIVQAIITLNFLASAAKPERIVQNLLLTFCMPQGLSMGLAMCPARFLLLFTLKTPMVWGRSRPVDSPLLMLPLHEAIHIAIRNKRDVRISELKVELARTSQSGRILTV